MIIHTLYAVAAIAFALLGILGFLLPNSHARYIVNCIGAEMLSLPVTMAWLMRRLRRKQVRTLAKAQVDQGSTRDLP